MGDLDNPFQGDSLRISTLAAEEPDTILCGGFTVSGLALELPEDPSTAVPGLLFRFARADGSGWVPVAIVLDDDRLARVPELIQAAVNAARLTASSWGLVDRGGPDGPVTT